MVRLTYSNRPEELLAELALRVRAEQEQNGPLVPVRIVVPSVAVEAYVRLGVARASGIAANLDVTLLTRFAGDLLGDGGKIRVADRAAIEGMALALFLDDAFVAHPELAEVRAYLRACGTAAGPIDVRRAQLAQRVGRLFEEYTYSRGDMLVAWEKGRFFRADETSGEIWQRRLWLAMFGPGGALRGPGEPRLVPLHEAVRNLGAARTPFAGQTVHVFAFAQVARTFHELFERIGTDGDVNLYAQSPCEGFWEDVDPRDPAPLVLWGRPGREQVRAWNALARFEHDDRFVDPLERPTLDDRTSAPSLLRRIQSDVLRREPRPQTLTPRGDAPADESVLVLQHANLRRELEGVASQIWDLVEKDPTLVFDEIAVLVPETDATAYAAHLPGVFREAHDLPIQSVGLSLAGASHVAEAIDLLLALPNGRFTRQDLMRVALHPSIAGSASGAERERWIAWCETLGIVHGASRADHEGTYIERDSLNWDQGLRRLALGSFMTGDPTAGATPFEQGGEQYVPFEVPPSELSDAASFGRLIRSLLGDASFARTAELTMAEWASFLHGLVEAYIAPSSDAEEEELARHLRRVHAIAAIDLDDRRIGYRLAHEIARSRLASVPRGRSGRGVVVSTFAAIRSLPFRVVFACGMGEGRFPSPEPDDPLDLRWARRREGDVTARDRDRYAFLEVLLGTRDRLVLSYVSRDAVTADALSPSSVVEELLHTIEHDYGVAPAAITQSHPLRRWDLTYFPDLVRSAAEPRTLGAMRLRQAREEAATLALRRSLENAGAGPATAADILARARAGDPAWAALAAHLGLATLPRAGSQGDRREPRIRVPLYAILKFLEFPLQGWASHRLGLEENDDQDPIAREDEPFETGFREETMFLRGVLLEAKRCGRPIPEVYDEAVRAKELRGAGPSGVFAKGERADHLATLATWQRHLANEGVTVESIEVHRFGRASERSQADRVHAGVALDVDYVDAAGVARRAQVELAGNTSPLGAGGRVSIALAHRNEQTDDWSKAGRQRAVLRGFLDHAVRSATGAAGDPDAPAEPSAPGEPREPREQGHASLSIVVAPETDFVDRVDFAPLTPGEATAWLRDVVRDLLYGSHAYFLPVEAVFVRDQKDPSGPVTPWLEQARVKLSDADGPLALRSAYGPVPRVAEYPLPDEEAAQAMIARRFGRLFDKRRAP